MIVGIVGAEAKKFTVRGRKAALSAITEIVGRPEVTAVTSGHCHLGGIDIWAEDIAKEFQKFNPALIFPPANLSWATGYQPRNVRIARAADILFCIVVDRLPPNFAGLTHDACYHCARHGQPDKNHVKSGGCWTMYHAAEIGKRHQLIIVEN